jgi:hypothetical protein
MMLRLFVGVFVAVFDKLIRSEIVTRKKVFKAAGVKAE